MGRGKVELKRIENPANRQVTFSKRRNGLLKKAFELSILCDAEVALLVFSPSGKAYQFASHDVDSTISRYRNEVGMTESSTGDFRTMEVWKSQLDELQRTIETMEAKERHFAGEDLAMLGMKELKQLERQMRIGVERIRSKKRRLVAEHINFLKKRHKVLQEENTRLQKRVKLHELHDVNGSSTISETDALDTFHRSDTAV
ncbi:truncated transcription factor CAULIFLOWER A-like isoform X2 [Impatiens glandulifera]|uniref:truncated transcription factor CAULIFLOWER A-like isoform X2 n=1 Tax=Impatiens glandulifera TaxID=253017 RepID=UPI001FB102DD|nr:truncated transcription factor CAULIFLOWER A-like isoform X2 [Impatiens glandulifera]